MDRIERGRADLNLEMSGAAVVIEKVDSVGARGAAREALEARASLFPPGRHDSHKQIGSMMSESEALEVRASLFKLPPDEQAKLNALRSAPQAKHTLRSWAYLYRSMITGQKKHDLRLNDRDYKVGDVCLMQEFDNTLGQYTGREARFVITYITGRDGVPCAVSSSVLSRDHVILSLDLIIEKVGR